MTAVNTTNIISAINQIIADAQDLELPGPCPYGTVNNTNIGCASWSTYTGTEGNTDTDGYYATYTVKVDTLQNIFDMALVTEAYYTSDGKTYATYTTNFVGNYLAQVVANVQISGSAEIYIPQSQTTATACLTCTSTKCNKCSLSCGCGLTTKSNSCDCTTTTTTWPSTYTSAGMIPFPTFPATVTATDATIQGNFTYTVSSTNPTSLPVKIITGSTLPEPIFLSNIIFSDIKITAANYSAPVIPGWPVSLNDDNINSLLTYVGKYLGDQLNKVVNKNVYEFTPNS
jgi:hypothetical protein